MGKTSEEKPPGVWKQILTEIGLTLAAVLGKEVTTRASDWVKENKTKPKTSKKSKNKEENGTRN